MSFGQAWDGAGTILALLGLLGVLSILFVMTQNIGNPEFDMIAAAEAGIYGVTEIFTPALVEQFILALLIIGLVTLASRVDWS